jgi:hypothetical protein
LVCIGAQLKAESVGGIPDELHDDLDIDEIAGRPVARAAFVHAQQADDSAFVERHGVAPSLLVLRDDADDLAGAATRPQEFQPHAPIVVEGVAQHRKIAFSVRLVGAGAQLEAESLFGLRVEQHGDLGVEHIVWRPETGAEFMHPQRVIRPVVACKLFIGKSQSGGKGLSLRMPLLKVER